MDRRELTVNGIRMVFSTFGAPTRPAVVVLHGFPDDRIGMADLAERIAAAGFFCIVPDQCGCGESDTPTDPRRYATPRLVDDIEALLEGLGIERCHLVGHDWGGAVAWTAGAQRRPWLDRLVVINVPHPGVFLSFLRRSPSQMLRSWYMLYFQIPRLPEWSLGRKGFAPLAAALRSTAPEGVFGTEELRRYRRVWARPGVITGMLNWYRAIRRQRPSGSTTVVAPTLVVWGDEDAVLDARLADLSAGPCLDARVAHLPGRGHWVHRESPEEVAALAVQHLGG